MTGAEVSAMYFSPFHVIIYMLIVLAVTMAYLLWKWSRHCDRKVKVLVVKTDGDTDTQYAPKSEGGFVALKAPGTNTTRLWPINKLSAIEMLYPGDGFIPRFLQKKIKTVIVDEEDWEPLLNRGSYSQMVASPDVVKELRAIAEGNPKVKERLNQFASNLTTAPTREMVASPAVLGNVIKEKASELAVTISKDTIDELRSIIRRLDQGLLKPMVLYGALVVLAIGLAYCVFLGIQSNETIEAIKATLGVP